MKIATAAYPVDGLDDWDGYARKITKWVEDADADLLVFPEYAGLELFSLAGIKSEQALSEVLPNLQTWMERSHALHQSLAQDHDCYILAGSIPVLEDGKIINRATFFSPSGQSGFQDKQIMTRFERENGPVNPGADLKVFDTTLGRIGILICYDCEFPLLARSLIEAGVEIILIPSCTDTLAGYHRVRIGAQARALEGQCITVQASTVGPVDWSTIIDQNIGTGGIFAPPDIGLPDDGVLAMGQINQPGWTRAEIDLDRIKAVRTNGAVLNHRHWAEQDARLEISPTLLSV